MSDFSMRPRPQRRHVAAVRLSDREKTLLETAADLYQTSQSEVLRAALVGPVAADMKKVAPHLFED